MIVIKRFFFILCLFCCGNTDSIELNINNFADLNSLIVTKIDYPKSDLAEKIRSGLPVHIVVYIDFISSSQDVVPYSYTITITKPIWPKTESLPYTIKTPQSLNEMSVSLPILLSYINNIRIPMNKKRLDNTQSIQVQAAINPFNISEILVDSQLNKSGPLEPESMLSNNQQVAQKKIGQKKG
ncbi:hypothetical protein CJF42_08855 [Pseudoalteromonas sp. NBT06-2]|uniref:hypothetical protein n=1 Tax=Pseudoalteromonas sp. NBT06-2 TaxID=2025950 RepID=UPI000BA7609B|nr:hypothetical protein [Pseudoalteromonas sp. NBT06-2]PAJ74779.1 hypothetical protein CJF42_08855 [Pseudoalteromonas sp. NBT06-2]